MGQLTTETKSWDPILPVQENLQGTGGTRMVHRQQLFAKLLMLDAEASNRNWALAEPNQPFCFFFWKKSCTQKGPCMTYLPTFGTIHIL